MSQRKKATDAILYWIDRLLPGSDNVAYYKERLDAMENEEFEQYMRRLKDGEEVLSLTVANLSEKRLSVERNFEIAQELGHSFFQRLWLTDPQTQTQYLTPVPYLVMDLPVKRQAQMLAKKSNIPEKNDVADSVTGQATGPSKGSSLSFPELQVLQSQGLEKTIEELIKYRGGDEKAYRAMNRAIIRDGSVSLSQIQGQSRVKGTETFSTYLKSAHLQNNL